MIGMDLVFFWNPHKSPFFKGPFLCLRQFLATESPLKMMKNLSHLQSFFVLEMLNLYPNFFGHQGERLDKIAKGSSPNFAFNIKHI